MTYTILVVDDEPTQLRLAEHAVSEKLHYHVLTASSGQQALDIVLSGREPRPDLILLDLSMPGMNGLDVIRAIRPFKPDLPIIVLTMYGDLEKAVASIKAGASDFLAKPVPLDRLRLSLQNVLRLKDLTRQVAQLQRISNGQVQFSDVVAQNEAMRRMVELGRNAADSDVPVLLSGESGAGREFFARAMHGSSRRAGRPFVVVSCLALAEERGEAVLFGEEKPVQGGSQPVMLGKLREARGGVLYLTGVERLPAVLQARLYDAIQSRSFMPMGAGFSEPMDMRVICASEREPARLEGMHEGFRALLDQYPIRLPALRERREDISLLADHFLRQYAAEEGRSLNGLTPQALEMLRGQPWPGNVRQLQKTLHRAILGCSGDHLEPRDFAFLNAVAESAGERLAYLPVAQTLRIVDEKGRLMDLHTLEAELIRIALYMHHDCISRAARDLGIGRSTLYRKLQEMNIPIREEQAALSVAKG